jgi:FtsH-binding integral membrane protein
MNVVEAQGDVRRIYRAGFAGPLVSAVVWTAASAIFTRGSVAAGMFTLFFGGILIFPLGGLVLTLLGGPTALPKGHPSAALAMQCAFTLPLGLVIAVALSSYAPDLFFPAALIIVGAHYLVFISLYGMRMFAVLAGVLVALGLFPLFVARELGVLSGWLGAAVFLIFAVLLFRAQGADR